MKKKLVHGLVVVSISSMLSAPCLSWAETAPQIPVMITGNQDTGEQTKITQAEALAIAQKAFNIPSDIKDVQIGFVSDDYFGRKYWQFSWNFPQAGGYGGIMVSVDATNGTIIDYSEYTDFADWKVRQSGVKLKSEQECAKIAENLAKTLIPDKFAQSKSKKTPFPSYYYPGSQMYTFLWERQANGIPFSENNIAITVNAETGKVNNYHLTWDDAAVFPNPSQAISPEQAKELFQSKLGLSLIYNRRYNPYSLQQNISKQPVELYYSSANMTTNPFTIDALTGQLVDPLGKPAKVAEHVYLQPLPELTANLAANPLSLEEAQAKLNEYLPGLRGYTIQSSQLNEGWGPGGEKSWQFQLQKSDSPQDPGYSVMINAVTGDLQNLNRFIPGTEVLQSTDPKLDYQECKQIAQSFVTKACGKKAGYLYLQESPVPTANLMSYNGQTIVQPSYSFSFTRIVNGIPYPGNQVYIEVNNQTGDIMNYFFNWESSAIFSPPENLITPQQAIDAVLQAGQTQLVYYRQLDASGRNNGKIGLTYRFMDDSSSLVDAKTGKLVSAWLEPTPVKLSDISGHQSEKAIKVLCDMGILDGSASKFYPDKGITRAELAKILVTTKGLEADSSSTPQFSDVPKTAWYYGWVQTASKAGLIKGSGSRFNPDQVVTRQEMVVMMLRLLKQTNTNPSANPLEENYLDGDKVAPWARSSYNQAAQMGMLTSRKGYLSPTKGATRGEAAIMLLRTIEMANRYGFR